MHPSVHSIIYNSPNMEASYVSYKRCMDKENLVHIYSVHFALYIWHHGVNRHEVGQTPGSDERQGGLAFFSREEFCTTW